MGDDDGMPSGCSQFIVPRMGPVSAPLPLSAGVESGDGKWQTTFLAVDRYRAGQRAGAVCRVFRAGVHAGDSIMGARLPLGSLSPPDLADVSWAETGATMPAELRFILRVREQRARNGNNGCCRSHE
jgi:hypothetical protein